ncbi:MAG: hypothetical protein NUV83_00570 [Candidatus Wolfebacteria bacterium]|nr:hypothetical protein [Candidatus Wolfebacteria bacterium]
MDYFLITEQQFQKRVYDLPSILKNALNSESVMGTVRHICQSHYFDDEKTLTIEQLTALVLSGFVAIEDMSKEIAENLEVNKQLADSIYQEIDKKIFISLKDEIKKIYSPLVVSKSALSWGAPKIELKPATKEDVVDLKTKSALGISSETIEIKSKEIFPEAVVLKKPEFRQEIKKEEPTVFGKIEPKVSGITLEKSLGEEEAPMILHKETELTPLAADKKSLAEVFTFSSGQEPAARKESSDLAAKISFGADVEKKKENKIQMEKPNVRVVHYSDLNTPMSPFGKEKPFQSQVFSQSKEINIGFEPKVVKMEEKKEQRDTNIRPIRQAQVFDSETQTRGGRPEQTEGRMHANETNDKKMETFQTERITEEKRIQVPLVEQSSIKIDNGAKIGFSAPRPEFGLSIKAAAEKKAFEDARKQMFKIEQKPEQKTAAKSPDELQLKDIPVEEDVIDLRKIVE